MVSLVTDVREQIAVPVVDQHVLGQPAGGAPRDGRQLADGLRREGRQGQQRQGDGDQEGDDQVALQRHAPAAPPFLQVVVGMPVAAAAAVMAGHGFASKP